MRVTSIIADVHVADIASATGFYADYLGMEVEELGLGWIRRYTSPGTGATIQAVNRDATAPVVPVATIKVDDVDEAYAEAQERGYAIVHPLTTEEWGVRRFFVRAPDGNVYNVAQDR
jgi:catechol 2,3-dioxygenase-like lactoylglutathione lyase family enzyme